MFPLTLDYYIYLYITLIIICLQKEVRSIGCYMCDSFNGSDASCRDPFHPGENYVKQCMQGRKGRSGVFPAQYCIKMNGIALSDGIEVMVRTCSLENLDHQCGIFNFQNKYYKGCLTTCFKNACNHGNSISNMATKLLPPILTTLFFYHFYKRAS